jgi:polyisoprenoid-binding protein YceI
MMNSVKRFFGGRAAAFGEAAVFRRAAAFWLAASFAAAAWGQSTALEIDPARTKVEYTVATTLHTVHGQFALKRGTIAFDTTTGMASGELVVDAASGESGSSGRDGKMHKSVLESGRYPEIVFRPDRVEGKVPAAGPGEVQLHGTFSIHGASHELTVPAKVEAINGEYAVEASFNVPYVKWGMKNPGNLLLKVNDQVRITVRTVARPAS